MSEQELLERISIRLSMHQELRLIYDEQFITGLTRSYRETNWLLWALCCRGSLMDSFWRRVVENLKILADEKAIQHFKAKLRTQDEVNLFGYLAELHFSAFFKRKGFKVVLNPPINDRSADFMIRNNNLPYDIYFEVKTFGAGHKFVENKIVRMILTKYIGKEDFPFGVFISEVDKIRVDEVHRVARIIVSHLRKIGGVSDKNLKLKIPIDGNRTILVEVCPHKVLSVAGCCPHVGHGRLKKFFGKALSQLPEDKPGVIIVVRPFEVSEEAIMDALYGEIAVPFYKEVGAFGEAYRKTNGFFHKVHRVSTVISARPVLTCTDFRWNATAYHNPNARFPLSEEIFKEICTKQLVPKNAAENIVELKWTS